ncbi:MAG: hypothetical protein KAH56_00325 [Candidatus Krumholzibacteria bacterium]|nr:hypothetical protein [Candidatus Krumholzibacteria bacterium]
MTSSRISGPRRPLHWSALFLATTLAMFMSGCTHVAGNYPRPHVRPVCANARFSGEGFQLLAGSRLRLDLVEAELGQLKSQGFSRRDPQIIKSVARRKHVPASLLADRSGNGYYRFTARLDPGTFLSLAPGSLEVTVMTKGGTTVVHDQGYLLEDRRIPEGCRPPSQSTLALGPPGNGIPTEMDFLVRLPVRGEIVDLVIVPGLCSIVSK